MNFFFVINGTRLKQIMIILVAALFAAGTIYAKKESISVFSTQAQAPSAVYQVDTNKKWIALTFDISWGEKKVEPILQVLKDKGVKHATFFLSSVWAQDHPNLVKQILDAGYEIGSHGHKHVSYNTLEDQEIRKQITTAHSILNKVTGKDPTLLRVPNGEFDQRVLQIASSLNYTVVQWGVDSFDWMKKDAKTIVNNVLTKAKKGDIVLMHASDSAKHTHEALPIIIDKLRDKGFELVTVSQLISQADLKHNEVQDKR
ncbi:polysaccharide deacetylase family sporulation protein PdaB [Marinicrinis lubricantis]|uniref:Polysaccharide deacetylase family sporulation protein PdaB n=1 Tax=Marinicrinis lubricantis TaxID=2086470 RepID=A0ABW1ISB8_9BACL